MLLKELLDSRDKVSNEVRSVGGDVNTKSTDIKNLIGKLSKSIDKIPTKFPEQIKTDLSSLEKGLLQLGLAIKEIPLPDIPKPLDITPQLSQLERKLGKRVHTFKIERGKDNLIHTITVVTK